MIMNNVLFFNNVVFNTSFPGCAVEHPLLDKYCIDYTNLRV